MTDPNEVDEFDTVDPVDSAFLPKAETGDEPAEDDDLYATIEVPYPGEESTTAEQSATAARSMSGSGDSGGADASEDDEDDGSDPFETWEE